MQLVGHRSLLRRRVPSRELETLESPELGHPSDELHHEFAGDLLIPLHPPSPHPLHKEFATQSERSEPSLFFCFFFKEVWEKCIYALPRARPEVVWDSHSRRSEYPLKPVSSVGP